MNPYKKELKQVAEYVQSFFEKNDTGKFLYHNILHTEEVVLAANQIANHYQLNDKEYFVVMAAAWFHDTGYFVSSELSEHEINGAMLADTFLTDKITDEKVIAGIKNCILSTKIPQNPKTRLEQIVCDADLFHLGTDSFKERNKLMHKEAESIKNSPIKKEDWRENTISLLEQHHYHTDYCQLLLDSKKAENLEQLKRKKLHGKNKPQITGKSENELTGLLQNEILKDNNAVPDNKEAKKEKKNSNRPERGIETVFRVSTSNNQHLSQQADNKAHIMITVNSLIISVLLSTLVRKFDEYSNLLVPTIILMFVNLVTIICAVLATRPTIPKGTFDTAEIEEKKVNLLFFGNFYKMNLEDYSSGMIKMMDDREFLYGSLIQDVYFQGIVLGKKYRLLRLSYNFFMFGLVASVIAFVIGLIL